MLFYSFLFCPFIIPCRNVSNSHFDFLARFSFTWARFSNNLHGPKTNFREQYHVQGDNGYLEAQCQYTHIFFGNSNIQARLD